MYQTFQTQEWEILFKEFSYVHIRGLNLVFSFPIRFYIIGNKKKKLATTAEKKVANLTSDYDENSWVT
jgi:hypothetical protein